MAEVFTPTPIVTFTNDTTAVNAVNGNFTAISTAFTDVLSRSGTTPNPMSSTLDMNSNQIINLPPPGTINSPARLADIVSNPNITIPPTGTSGAVVPFLNGNNTWSGLNTYSSGGGIAYTNPSAGSVARTVNAKLNEWVSILDFGADNTGVTANFGTAFNLAMTAMTSAGIPNRTLYIPQGVYLIGSTVPVWQVNVDIWAAPGAYIQANVSIPQMLKTNTGINNRVQFQSLYGGQWDGNNNVTQDGFTIADYQNIRISNIVMFNCFGNAGNGSTGGFIRLGNSAATVQNTLYIGESSFWNFGSSIVAGNYGIFVDPSSTAGASDCRFHNLVVTGNQIGIQGKFFDGVFEDVHIFSFIPGTYLHGFQLTTGQNRLTNCNVDAPITSGNAAYDLTGTSGPYVLLGNSYFENINNGTVNCVNIGSGSQVLSYGNYWFGNPATKIAADYVGSLAGLRVLGDYTTNVNNVNAYGLQNLSGASGSQLIPDGNIIINPSGTFTVTLYSPSLVPNGSKFTIKTVANFVINSASANIVPLAGGAAGTAILAATAGKWATLQSDGTNWNIIASN